MASALHVDARLKSPAWKLFPGRHIAWRTRRSRSSKSVRRFNQFVPIPGLHRTLFTVLACKTGGFQESKVNYFNDLQKLRGQLIRLSIRAGTGIEPFKTKAYTGGREIGFGGLVPIRSRWPRNFALSEVALARGDDPGFPVPSLFYRVGGATYCLFQLQAVDVGRCHHGCAREVALRRDPSHWAPRWQETHATCVHARSLPLSGLSIRQVVWSALENKSPLPLTQFPLPQPSSRD